MRDLLTHCREIDVVAGGRNWGGQGGLGPPSFLDLFSKNIQNEQLFPKIYFFYLVVPSIKNLLPPLLCSSIYTLRESEFSYKIATIGE